MADVLSRKRMVDPVLTNLIQGYDNPEFIADRLFPIVDVDEEAGIIPQLTDEHFKQYNTERAVHGDTNLAYMEHLDAGIDFKLREHDLGIPIDYREEEAIAKILSLQQHAADKLGRIFSRRREIVVANLVQNTGNYTYSNTSSPSTKWDQANSTPVKDIRAAAENIRQRIGIQPNTIVIPSDVWATLADHVDVLARMSVNSTQVPTEQIFGTIIGIPNVLIGSASYKTDGGTMTPIWSDKVVLANVTPGVRAQRNPYIPAFGYTLVKRGWPQVDKYPKEGNKVIVVRNTVRETSKFHGNIAGYLLSNVLNAI